MAGLKGAADRAGVPFSVDSEGGMFGFFLFDTLPQNYAKVMTPITSASTPSSMECWKRASAAPALYEAGFAGRGAHR
ncbi:MAG: hypothetical protein IPH37_19855 [Burkholderiales bacterium]|nr:hypothetical protein [Burkholderiales bacterium]